MKIKKKFKDLDVSDPYYGYILELYNKGFINGYSDGTFKPNNFITRSEILKLIFLIKNISLSDDKKDYFIDVLGNSWQKKYINTAVNLGLISTSNKKFNPNGYITKAEALKIIIKFFVGDIDVSYSKNLADVSGSDWYAKYIEYAINNNLIKIKNNYFYPNRNITRYEVIGILYNLSKNLKEKGVLKI